MGPHSSRRGFVRQCSTALVSVSLASIAGCLGILVSDRARYYTISEIEIDNFDYDATRAAGEAAGYAVDGPYYGTLKEPTGIHPDGIDELDARFRPDYRVEHVVFHYTSITRLRAWFRADAEAEVAITDERAWIGPDPFLPEYLPDEAWLIERLTLLFDIESDRAREYARALMDAITEEQTDLPSIDIAETVTFGNAYRHIVQERTAFEGSHSGGGGWHIVTSFRDDVPVAEVGFQLQSTKVSHSHGTGRYTVQFDPLGAVGLDITLSPGESIPVGERRSVFREMFNELRMPSDLVDAVEFEYVGSMW